jgi:hypothetical protein
VTARVEFGDEQYVVTNGRVTAVENDVVHGARADYLDTIAPAWLDQAQRDGIVDRYVPDRDCALARIIAQRINGRFSCDPSPEVPEGVHP